MTVAERIEAFEVKLQAAQERMAKARAELAAALAAYKGGK